MKTSIEVNDLTIGYQSEVILKQIYARLSTGRLVGFIGRNGVGKSTLLKTICGLIEPIQGEITIENQPIDTFSKNELAKKISIGLTHKIDSPFLTVRELISFGRYPYTRWLGTLSEEDEHLVDSNLKKLDLTEIAHKKIGNLSDGQLQKAMLARVLSQDTPFILLDEPLAHLDLTNKYQYIQLLQRIAEEQNKGILFTTHDIQIAITFCDRMWCVHSEKPLVYGKPDQLLANKIIHQCLDLPLDVEI